MKKILTGSLFLLACIFIFTACEKDDNQVKFENGTAPTLSANVADSIALSKDNKDKEAITFNWTNPSYKFNTGSSSQDVAYTVQMRVKGTTTWTNTATVTKANSITVNQGVFNDYLIKQVAEGGLNLPFDVVVSIDVRVASYLGALSATNATALYSNVMTFKTKPYSVLPDLWVTGDGTPSGWTNTPPASQKLTYDLATKKFTITIQLEANKYYKFLEKQGAWQPQWGGAPKTGGNMSVNPGGGSDPDAVQVQAITKMYTLTVDLSAKTLVVQ